MRYSRYFLSLLAFCSFMTMGVAPNNQAEYIARAATLSPEPIAAVPTEPIVKQEVVQVGQQPSPAYQVRQGASTGSVAPGNNCVACVRFKTGRSQSGNAGTWSATHSTPRIGDIMILRPGEQGAGSIGHVMVVVGINGNRISTWHCNFPNKTVFIDNGRYY